MTKFRVTHSSNMQGDYVVGKAVSTEILQRINQGKIAPFVVLGFQQEGIK